MKINKKTRTLVHSKFNCRCAYCGEKIDESKMHIDHVIPKIFYITSVKNNHNIPHFLKHLGVDDVNHIDNLFPSCRVCNNWKNSFGLEEFRHELSEQINRLNLRSSNYRIAKKYGLIVENIKTIKFHFEKPTFKKRINNKL